MFYSLLSGGRLFRTGQYRRNGLLEGISDAEKAHPGHHKAPEGGGGEPGGADQNPGQPGNEGAAGGVLLLPEQFRENRQVNKLPPDEGPGVFFRKRHCRERL